MDLDYHHLLEERTYRMKRLFGAIVVLLVAVGAVGALSGIKEQFDVIVGDTICIPPGTPHCIKNIGTEALHILCMCSPPYNHDDTELLEQL